MALAGCTGVFIGFESLTDQNLADARKRTPRAEDYARRVRMFHEHGIQVNGSFVVGFDGDRKDTFTTLVQWIEAIRMECATFHILTPYPGTPLFRQFEAEGRLLHRDWEKYDTAHVVFRPKQMTPEELLLGYDWLYRRLFSHASIWRRKPRGAFSVARVFCRLLSLQTLEPALAFSHQTPIGSRGLVAAGGNDASAGIWPFASGWQRRQKQQKCRRSVECHSRPAYENQPN